MPGEMRGSKVAQNRPEAEVELELALLREDEKLTEILDFTDLAGRRLSPPNRGLERGGPRRRKRRRREGQKMSHGESAEKDQIRVERQGRLVVRADRARDQQGNRGDSHESEGLDEVRSQETASRRDLSAAMASVFICWSTA